MTKRLAVISLSTVLALGLAACGGDDDDDDAASDNGGGGVEAAVLIEGFAFDVQSPVEGGAEFTVANGDSATHTFTSDDDAWDAAEIAGDTEAQVIAPSEAGDYAFHCTIHPNMTGTLTVT
ncbi:MAG: cupredoxin domain-containing protein [Acidimicrobiia bacterium]